MSICVRRNYGLFYSLQKPPKMFTYGWCDVCWIECGLSGEVACCALSTDCLVVLLQMSAFCSHSTFCGKFSLQHRSAVFRCLYWNISDGALHLPAIANSLEIIIIIVILLFLLLLLWISRQLLYSSFLVHQRHIGVQLLLLYPSIILFL